MASRYTYSKILKTNETKKQYLESTIYPQIKPTDEDVYVITTSNDRLDLLAQYYYGDKNLWWIIAVANNLNNASLSIQSGIQMRIPSNVSKILNDLEKVDTQTNENISRVVYYKSALQNQLNLISYTISKKSFQLV